MDNRISNAKIFKDADNSRNTLRPNVFLKWPENLPWLLATPTDAESPVKAKAKE
jgi:hypothetical protein